MEERTCVSCGIWNFLAYGTQSEPVELYCQRNDNTGLQKPVTSRSVGNCPRFSQVEVGCQSYVTTRGGLTPENTGP